MPSAVWDRISRLIYELGRRIAIHPSIVEIEVVGGILVAEDVDKEERLATLRLLLRLQPGRDLVQKRRIFFHVFEHLYREDTVEPVIEVRRVIKVVENVKGDQG